MSDNPPENLLASHGTTPATKLPDDPAARELAESGRERFLDIVSAHPESSLCWALLAEGSLNAGQQSADLSAYAYARTGYHRGLDKLRRSGWKGSGPVPWEHAPNRGWLRCVWALAVAAHRIGEIEEYRRCAQLLRDSSFTAYDELTDQRPIDAEAKSGEAAKPAEGSDAKVSADKVAESKADESKAAGNKTAENKAADRHGSSRFSR